MRINKLELHGFKSFPDRTAFEFGEGISCVVGPNGSGKSNVVDALRWVIGEQSARSLRGKEMSDVIFAGSAVRSPVGFAEVILTLGVGVGEPFPGDYARFEELEVGRRLYRDGTSEYLVNRVKARRRDIVDLFLDTGVGANLYSFIAQGQVDRIVSQSANERRSLIDEAAGISRYKIRRDEALVRLQATAGQLDRAADVADEMGRRLKTLSRQVLRAGRFRRLRARIRQREIALAVVKYSALSDDRRHLRKQLRALKDRVGALERSIGRIETDLHTRDAEVESVRAAVSTWRDQAAELEAARREQDGAASLHRSRHDELMAEARRAGERRERAMEQRAAADSTGQEVESGLAETTAALERVDVAAAESEHERARADVERCRSVVEELGRRVAALRARRATLTDALSRVQPLAHPPLPEAGDVDTARTVVEEARRALAVAEAAEEAAQEQLRAVRDSDRVLRAQIDALLEEHSRVLVAFDEERRRLERERVRAVKAAEEGLRDAERRADRAHRDRLAAASRRLEAWTAAARSDRERRRKAITGWGKQHLATVRADLQEHLARLQSGEVEEVDRARASVDTSEMERAQAATEAWERAEHEAREARDAAVAALAAARSRKAALDAEWRVLEEQRAATVPPGWRGLAVFDGMVADDDPRRVARPDLLGLPVVQTADLVRESTGRAVLADSETRWRLADSLEDAVHLLQTEGPPVASRDGAIRVDADGVVELGWQSGSRWAEVRGLRAEATDEVDHASSRQESAREAHQKASAELVAARRRRGDAEKEHQRSVERAVREARARVAGRTEEARERSLVAETEVQSTLEARLAALEEEHRLEVPLERGARRAIQELVAEPSTEVEGARASLEAIPELVAAERPKRPELPQPDPAALAAAEQRVDACRRSIREARHGVERAEEALRRALARSEARRLEESRREEEAARRTRDREALEAQLAELTEVEGVEEARRSLEQAASRAEAVGRSLLQERERRSRLREELAGLRSRREAAEAERKRASEEIARAEAERERSERQAIEALESSRQAQERAEALAIDRGEVMARLSTERERLGRLVQELNKVRESLEKSRSELGTSEAQKVEVEARVTQTQLDIEGIRKRIGDRYQISLPGLLDRLAMRRELTLDVDPSVAIELVVGETVLEPVPVMEITASLLDDEDRVVGMVRELEELRGEIQKIGEVNLAAEQEYRELRDRWEELDRQRADLEASVKSIRAAIAKMNRTCRERFRDAYDRVNEAFQEAYPKLVGGGDARLALTDEEDLLETGVDIFVRPPGKRLQNLTLLSGGEKAMTAIALLLAIFRVRPSPFCVLDEVDAPLDEANGHRFNAMIREMSSMSQFIVITHNRTTMECADVLYGVTMADPGVSKLVSVALDRF